MELRTAKSHVTLQGKRLVGVAAPYSVPTTIANGGQPFDEIIEPGAFKSAVESNADVRMLAHHDVKQVLGRTSSGTLQLTNTNRGLEFSCVLPSWADDLHESVRRGDISGMSFGFNVNPGDERWEEQRGKPVRHINNVSQLLEISVVAFPAYQSGTSVDARDQQLNIVSAETRSMVEQFEGKRSFSQSQVFNMTAEFVREQLSVPLFWDSKGTARPMEDQMKLMRMATDYFEMRSRGVNVEIRRDENNWPSIDYTAMHQADMARHMSRRRRIFSFTD